MRSNRIKTFYGQSVTGGLIRIHSLVAESLPSKEWARVRFPLDANCHSILLHNVCYKIGSKYANQKYS